MATVKYLYLNSRDELLRIDISCIVYFEAEGNYTKIHLANGQTGLVCMSLAKMEELVAHKFPVAKTMFARIGKKFIINMGDIYRISVLRQELVLSDQRTYAYKVEISKDALKKLKDIITNTPNN